MDERIKKHLRQDDKEPPKSERHLRNERMRAIEIRREAAELGEELLDVWEDE